MISQRARRILDDECIELEIKWLENDVIEGVDSYVAKKLLVDRKTKIKKKPEEPSGKTDWRTRIEIKANCWDSPTNIKDFYDYCQTLGSVISLETKTPTHESASFRILMSPFFNVSDEDSRSYTELTVKISNRLISVGCFDSVAVRTTHDDSPFTLLHKTLKRQQEWELS